MSKAFIADRYVNRITHRSPRGFEQANQVHVSIHSTWEEAHKWLLDDREKKVEAAKKALEQAQSQLKRAAAMKPKEQINE